MAQTKTGFLANFEYAQIWRVDDDCYAMGTLATPNSPVADTEYAAYLLRNVGSNSFAAPSRSKVDFMAAGRTVGSHQLGLSSIDQFDLVTADIDADTFALVTDSTVDQTTNTDWTKFAANNNLTTLPRVGLSLHYAMLQTSTTCTGAIKWLNLIFPACQISAGFTGLTPGTEAPLTMQVQPTMTGKWPSGLAVTQMALEDNRDFVYGIISDNPLAIITYFADGVTTVWNTVYKPTSTVVTINDSPNEFAVNGTLTALTSITTAGVVTMAAAGSADDINVLTHETEFVAV